MTVEDALKKATEGGYHIYGADGVDTHYEGANSDFSAWTRTDNASTFMVAVEETFLDPHFWQTLGKALGWDQTVVTMHTVENGRPTIVPRAGQHWLEESPGKSHGTAADARRAERQTGRRWLILSHNGLL